MELRRFFVDASSFDGKDTIIIKGVEFLHLKSVLRMKLGYKIIVCLNDGIEHYSEIVKIDKMSATVRIISSQERLANKHKIVLFSALLKNNKLDLVIQKAVELGVDEIIPFTSQYCNETKFNLERAKRIALESAKQCGSATLTIVKPLLTFEKVLTILPDFDNVILPYEDESKKNFKDADFNGDSFAVLIGSEGGFSQDEVGKAKEKNAQIVSLGRRILRADTASIVTVALLMNELGELSV